MARIDRAKNTLRSAKTIRNLSGSQSFSDSVGQSDNDDLYRIQVNQRSTLNLNVVSTGKRSKVAVQLFTLKQSKQALKAIGRTAFSDLSAKETRKYINRLAARNSSNKPIDLAVEAGTYYVRVYRQQGENRYQIKFASDSNTSTAPSTPDSSVPFLPPTWIRQFGTDKNDYGFGTATDNAGDLYVSGVTTSSGAFSGSGFVAKYKKDGSQEWLRPLSIPGSVAVSDVAVDAAGNYYVAGAKVNGINSDGFLVKYNSVGETQWTKTIESTLLGFNAADAASGIVLDGNDVYLTGIRGGAPAPFSQGKAFIAKYSSDGNTTTGFGNNGIIEFGNAKTTAASGITLANGNLYITGITDATLSLSGNNEIDLTGGDAFVAGFNAGTGSLLWNQTLSSGAGTDYARGIAVSGSDLYVVGQTAGKLASGSLPANVFAGGEADAFLAKYSATGTPQWVKQFGGNGLDAAQAVAVDPAGKIYLTGETNTKLFGTAFGGSDAWIAQADSNGSLVSTTQVGTSQNDEAYSIVTDALGTLYVVGQTQGTFSAATSQNQGNYDVWLSKYG